MGDIPHRRRRLHLAVARRGPLGGERLAAHLLDQHFDGTLRRRLLGDKMDSPPSGNIPFFLRRPERHASVKFQRQPRHDFHRVAHASGTLTRARDVDLGSVQVNARIVRVHAGHRHDAQRSSSSCARTHSSPHASPYRPEAKAGPAIKISGRSSDTSAKIASMALACSLA